MSLEDLMEQLSSSNSRVKNRRTLGNDLISQFLQSKAQQQTRRGPGGMESNNGQGRGAPNAPKVAGGSGGLPGTFKGLISPVKGVSITSNYGPRVHPVHGGRSNHTGVDLDGGPGTPIRAAMSGRVKKSRYDSIYGNQIILGHGRKRATMYGHLNKSLVKPGQRVRRGQVIGYMGSTGLSTGDHLHFETWLRGQPQNPMRYLGGKRKKKRNRKNRRR